MRTSLINQKPLSESAGSGNRITQGVIDIKSAADDIEMAFGALPPCSDLVPVGQAQTDSALIINLHKSLHELDQHILINSTAGMVKTDVNLRRGICGSLRSCRCA